MVTTDSKHINFPCQSAKVGTTRTRPRPFLGGDGFIAFHCCSQPYRRDLLIRHGLILALNVSKRYSEFTKNFSPGGLPNERGRDALRLT